MRSSLNFKQLGMDVWLVETLLLAEGKGYSLDQLRAMWKNRKGEKEEFSRMGLYRHRNYIKEIFGLEIEASDRKHYRIVNPEKIRNDGFIDKLLSHMQSYLFLDEVSDLGAKVQPEPIFAGMQYLHSIGLALRHNLKLHVVYQKFSDSVPYETILCPYCVKQYKGRWYILAHKEDDERDIPAQTFALDRILSLILMDDTFIPDPSINPETYFQDSFGIWVDERRKVQDIQLSVSSYAAHYFRSMPLHHSQKELQPRADLPGRFIFQYHIIPSPDFLGELASWGDQVEILTKLDS